MISTLRCNAPMKYSNGDEFILGQAALMFILLLKIPVFVDA